MSGFVDRLAARRGFTRCFEREPAPRQQALDRVLSSLLGRLLGWLDCAPLNRLDGRPDPALASLDDATLDERIAALRTAMRRSGPTAAAVAAALPLVAEVARRSVGIAAHREQLAAAALMLRGQFVEMATGEGKSLTAAITAALGALGGLPVEVFTVNDYLAARDARAFAPLFQRLKLRCGLLAGEQSQAERGVACTADVLYVVNKDYVFDHLRERAFAPASAAQRSVFAGRGLFFAIVDEADSILVDEARTPLVIAQESARLDAAGLQAVAALAASLSAGGDYTLDRSERRVTLRAPAVERIAELREATVSRWPARQLRELVEQAIAAAQLYRRDRDYIVDADGKVVIVDEYTGRVLADRSWERGLHQFVEIKEGLQPSAVRETIARTTYPEFFRRYLMLAGTSGTLAENRAELMTVYGARVRRVPTHRPVRRRVVGPYVHRDAESRWQAVVEAVHAGVLRGQAVLVGTRSVAASEEVAARLQGAGIGAAVLNARHHAAEAALIAEAGSAGRVTVATNMAGRGTDIAIDDRVRAAGGLLVVLTELHESARIDRQLMGRCARQGDPGECIIFASLEDELFKQHSSRLAAAFAGLPGQGPLPGWAAALLRRRAQATAEARHRAERAQVLERNEWLSRQLAFAGGAA